MNDNKPMIALRHAGKRLCGWFPDLRLPAGMVLLFLSLIQLTFASGIAGAFYGLLGIGSLWWLARKWQYRLIGPLFYHELIRLARSGWTTWLRCAYGLALLGALWFAHADWMRGQGVLVPPGAATDESRLAEHFTMTIFIVQNLAGIFLTSLYVSGSLIDDRQNGILQSLLITHLHDHEIVAGKLFARLATVASILLTGLPVLGLIQMWGGVDIRMLVAGFASTLAMIFFVGCISILYSATSRSRVFAFFLSQGLYWMLSAVMCVPVLGFAASPFYFLPELESRLRGTNSIWAIMDPFMADPMVASQEIITLQMIGGFILGQSLLGVFFLRLTVWMLRDCLLERSPPSMFARMQLRLKERYAHAATKSHKDAEIESAHQTEIDMHRAHLPHASTVARSNHTPLQIDHPLWWWETRTPRETPRDYISSFSMLWLFVAIAYLAVVVLTAHVAYSELSDEIVRGLNLGLRIIIVFAAGVACCTTAFSATSALSKERAKRTLESLFLLPETWTRIFVIKFLALVLKNNWPLSYFALFWTMAALTPALHIGAVLLLIVALAVHVTFFASLGMWLALACKSGMRATLTMAGVILAVTAGSWLLLQGVFLDPFGDWVIYAINPIMTWWGLAFSWRPTYIAYGYTENHVGMALLGVFGYALAAVLFWWIALRRFHSEPTRSR